MKSLPFPFYNLGAMDCNSHWCWKEFSKQCKKIIEGKQNAPQFVVFIDVNDEDVKMDNISHKATMLIFYYPRAKFLIAYLKGGHCCRSYFISLFNSFGFFYFYFF